MRRDIKGLLLTHYARPHTKFPTVPDPGRVIHSLDSILRTRILAIACGYEDADDLDTLRHDPGFKALLSSSKGWR